MNPSMSFAVEGVWTSWPEVGSKSTRPENSPARKYDPSVAITAAASEKTWVARGIVPTYAGRQVPPPAKLASQSAAAPSQLAYPAAQTALAQELALLHVNTVLASGHDLSPHAPQLRSVPSAVSQPGSGVQSA